MDSIRMRSASTEHWKEMIVHAVGALDNLQREALIVFIDEISMGEYKSEQITRLFQDEIKGFRATGGFGKYFLGLIRDEAAKQGGR